MSDPISDSAPAATAEELDRLERELAIGRDEVVDLNKRARVVEIETGSWKRPSPSLSTFTLLLRVIPIGFIGGYMFGHFVTTSLVELVAR